MQDILRRASFAEQKILHEVRFARVQLASLDAAALYSPKF